MLLPFGSPDGIFTKNFTAVFAVNLVIMASYYMLFVISGPYVIERFSASPGTAGLTVGVMVLGCLTGRFFIGGLLHRLDFRKVLIAGCAAYIAAVALYPAADSLPMFALVRWCSGVAVGCAGTAAGTAVACMLPPARRGAGIGCFSMSAVIAMAVGPFLGIFLMPHMSWTALFHLCTVGSVASLLFSLPVRIPKPSSSSSGAAGMPSPTGLQKYISYRAVPLCIPVLIAGVCYACVQAFISFHAKGLGITEAASFFFLAYAAAAFVARPPAGKIFDSRGENILVYPTLCIAAASLCMLATATTGLMLLASGALLGIGFGVFQTTAQSAALKKEPPERFGQATSTFFILLELGIGFGPYLMGLLVPFIGYDGLFFASAGLTLAAIPIYHLLHGAKAAVPLKQV